MNKDSSDIKLVNSMPQLKRRKHYRLRRRSYLLPLSPEGAPALEVDAEQLLAEKKQWMEKAARLQDQLLRTQSDIENIRKRFQREREDTRAQITAELLGVFIPVLDHFDLALNAVETTSDARPLIEGLFMIQRELDGILQSLGLEKITDLGKLFDPTMHEAVATGAEPDKPDHTILEALRPGWRYHKRCLRATMVKVNRLNSAAPPTPKPTLPPSSTPFPD